jgi:hypothetical protein
MLGTAGTAGATISMVGAELIGAIGVASASMPTLAGGGPSLPGGGGIFFGGLTGSAGATDGAQPPLAHPPSQQAWPWPPNRPLSLLKKLSCPQVSHALPHVLQELAVQVQVLWHDFGAHESQPPSQLL